MRSSARRVLILVSSMVAAAIGGRLEVATAQTPAGGEDIADACFSAAERSQPLLRQKKLREARALLEVCARDGCPRVARSDCREWLAEATDAQPSIVIAAHEVHGIGKSREVLDVHDIRAVIDDSLFVDRVDSTPIVIDPGRHRLRLERAGAEAVMQDIDIREGEKARVVDVYWHDAATVAPPRPILPIVFALGAAGVVAVGVGTYFEITGLTKRGDLDSCKATASCTQAQVDSARSEVRAGDVTIGAGILLGVGSAILYFARPSVGAADTPSDSHQAAWIVVVPGGFVAGARGAL